MDGIQHREQKKVDHAGPKEVPHGDIGEALKGSAGDVEEFGEAGGDTHQEKPHKGAAEAGLFR